MTGNAVPCRETCPEDGCTDKCVSIHQIDSKQQRHRHRTWGGGFHYWHTDGPLRLPSRRVSYWSPIQRPKGMGGTRHVYHAWNRDGWPVCRRTMNRDVLKPSYLRYRDGVPKGKPACQHCLAVLELNEPPRQRS